MIDRDVPAKCVKIAHDSVIDTRNQPCDNWPVASAYMSKVIPAFLLLMISLRVTVRPAHGQVRLTPNACNLEQTLISLNAATPTSIIFVNSTNQTVRVYWRDYSGRRILYTALPAGVTFTQPTYLTHPWIITNVSDQCLLVFKPVVGPGTAIVQPPFLNAGVLLSQTGLTFRAVSGGGSVPPKTFTVLAGAQPVPWSLSTSTVSGGSAWLQATPATGLSNPATAAPLVLVSVNPAGLSPGSYYGQITVTPADNGSLPQLVTVVLNVLTPDVNPGPVAEPNGLIFAGAPGASDPPAQLFQVSNLTSRPFSFNSSLTAPPGKNWFAVQPPAATVAPGQPVVVKVQPSLTGLSAGVYPGSITLTFSDGNSRIINLLLVVAPGAVSPASGMANDIRAAGCAPTKLLPVFTLLGANFTSPTAWPTPIEVFVIDDCGAPLADGSVIASFSNGDPPLALTAVRNGRWSATWTPRNARNAATTVTVNAVPAAGNIQGATQVAGGVQANPNVPVVSSGGIVGAASYNAYPAPGTLIAIFGSALSEAPAAATGVPLSTSLATTSVFLSGQSLPLISAADGQVNAMIPYNLSATTRHQLIVKRGASLSVPEPIALSTAQPAIFSVDSSGKGQGHIYKATAAGEQILAGPANPAGAGDVLVMYCAGLGLVDPPVPAGAPAPDTVLTTTINPVTALIGGKPAKVLFSGLTAGFTGLYQINAIVPDGVTPGDAVPVVLQVADQASLPVIIAVR